MCSNDLNILKAYSNTGTYNTSVNYNLHQIITLTFGFEAQVKELANKIWPVPPAGEEQVPVEPRHELRLEPVREAPLLRLIQRRRLHDFALRDHEYCE